MKLMLKTVRKIIIPGPTAIHHAMSRKSRLSLNSRPHVGTSGSKPIPRKLNVDSAMIAAPTPSEAATITSLGTCNGAVTSGNDIASNDLNPDTMTANGAALAFGTIALGDNGYLSGADTAKNSTCVWTAGNTVLTITLAGVSPGKTGTVAAGSTATYLPNAAITSATGEAIDTGRTPSVTGVLF